uniref:Putative site-specific DNA endonuclease n=1 Tax=Tupiella akineta TaxID=160070 RepID=Q6UVQ9_TUPAK|nr:putative site-specific DNA endonuclease [Tupiella akineta]AAQ18765.1 putative site-specific DNA endonuclease [Tupiella akineta]
MSKSIKQDENKPSTSLPKVKTSLASEKLIFSKAKDLQKNESQKLISIHAPKAKKPQTKEEFGQFLAGLIDSDGHITKDGCVNIAFNTNDISVAYYIKSAIGYGKVTREKYSFVVRYSCRPILGLVKIADLIRFKLKHLDKIAQFNSRLVPKLNCDPTIYTDSDISQNHWLAGFIQGDGCLSLIQQLDKRRLIGTVPETRIVVAISQKAERLLTLIKAHFGGCVRHRKAHATYYYISNSFTNAVKFINYLDKFQLMGNKLTQYWIWRKAYLIVQSKQHLTEKGSAKIAQKKANLSKMRANDVENLSDEVKAYRLNAKQKRAPKQKTSANLK